MGYNITLGQIEREIQLGQTAIRSAANELKKAGWLTTQRTHDDRGFNAGLAWILTDPEADNPDLENPTLANPTLEKQATYREYKLNENTNKRRTYEQTESFSEFWNLYPRKIGKQAALRAFIKAADKTDSTTIIAGVQRMATDPNLPPKQFIPHPATWLNEGRWDDEPYPERDRATVKQDNRAKAAQILREIGQTK